MDSDQQAGMLRCCIINAVTGPRTLDGGVLNGRHLGRFRWRKEAFGYGICSGDERGSTKAEMQLIETTASINWARQFAALFEFSFCLRWAQFSNPCTSLVAAHPCPAINPTIRSERYSHQTHRGELCLAIHSDFMKDCKMHAYFSLLDGLTLTRVGV
jgi:hypothetical protein